MTKYRLPTYNSIVIHASKNTKGTLHGVMNSENSGGNFNDGQIFSVLIVSLSDEGIKMFSVTQALFAGSIPEIIDIVKMFPKYNGTYVNDRGRRHVTD